MNIQFLLEAIDAGKTDNPLGILYGTSPEVLQTQRLRYQRAIRRFAEIFPERDDVQLFSAPGRTEIGGNHTDHQRGIVLAGAVLLLCRVTLMLLSHPALNTPPLPPAIALTV